MLAAAVLITFSPAVPAAPAAPADPLATAQSVLDARSAAVRSGNRDGWMATVDPQAPAAFRTAQGLLFDGLHSLPLASYSLQARTADSGDLGPAVAGKYAGAPVLLPETRQRMRFQNFDATDDVASLWLTFVQRAGSWYVAADRDLEPLGLDTARGLWDFGPVQAQPSAHFLVLSHPDQAARAAALSGIAEEAIAALAERWTQPWPGQIPLILPGSVDELQQLLQATVDLTKFVAFVAYGSVRDDGWTPTAPRIYIQDRNLSRYGHSFQVDTLTHELDHAAVAPLAGPFIPSWVHEGVADWVATGRRLNEPRPAKADPTMPRDYQFATGSQDDIVKAYAESRSAIGVLARAKGVDAPGEFIRALGDVKVAPGSVDYQADAALRRSAGLGVADLEALWRR
jgi:hypothetical protein